MSARTAECVGNNGARCGVASHWSWRVENLFAASALTPMTPQGALAASVALSPLSPIATGGCGSELNRTFTYTSRCCHAVFIRLEKSQLMQLPMSSG